MIESIIRLSSPAWLPCTRQFDVSKWIRCDVDGDGAVDQVRLCLESVPPVLVFESSAQAQKDGSGVTVRAATDAEFAAILAGLTDDPPHPNELTPLEVMSKFSDSEQDLIEDHARRLARQLFSAIGPISWDIFEGSCRQLLSGGILTTERFTEITGRAP